MNGWRKSLIMILLVGFAFTLPGRGQSGNAEDEQIVFNVTVIDKSGQFIKQLGSENFKLYIDDAVQPITSFSAEDAPATIGILVDRSGSIKSDEIDNLPGLLTNFIDNGNPNNEYFLMTFSETPSLLVELTQNADLLARSIQKLSTTKPKGNTSFNDALKFGLEKISSGKFKKKVMIVISDALDNTSKTDFGGIRRAVKKSDVILYNFGLLDPEKRTEFGPWQYARIEELTAICGGKAFAAHNVSRLNKFLLETVEELRTQYTIGFKPDKTSEKNTKETWHKIKVNVEIPLPAAKTWKPYVYTRTGYYSGN
jgi:Ca-activated chloride channel homolog